MASGALSPEVAARFAAAEENEAGDTWEVAPHKETPTKSLGAKKLLSLFDEPEGEDLQDQDKKPEEDAAKRQQLEPEPTPGASFQRMQSRWALEAP